MGREVFDDTGTWRHGDAERSRHSPTNHPMSEKRLTFQYSRKDLYDVFSITAAQRPFRRVAMPALAGFVFLGHAIDGNYDKAIIWAVIVAFLYWSISHGMYWLHVYGAANETLMAPQELELLDDMMVVTSEYSTEKFLKPDPLDVHVDDEHVVVSTSTGKLVFLEGSFEKAEDYLSLKGWLKSSPPRNGESENGGNGERSGEGERESGGGEETV